MEPPLVNRWRTPRRSSITSVDPRCGLPASDQRPLRSCSAANRTTGSHGGDCSKDDGSDPDRRPGSLVVRGAKKWASLAVHSRHARPSCGKISERSSPSSSLRRPATQGALDSRGPFQETPSQQGKAQTGKGLDHKAAHFFAATYCSAVAMAGGGSLPASRG